MSEYKYIIIPFITLIISQIIKTIVEMFKTKKFNIKRLLDGTAGMPSSHSAFITSATSLIGINFGITNPYFAVLLVFTIIVLYDARGLRYETGKQAAMINKLIEKNNLKENKLNEQLGHTTIEVFCGCLLGIVSALFFNMII